MPLDLITNPPLMHSLSITDAVLGWDEGVMQMTLGEKATLTISP